MEGSKVIEDEYSRIWFEDGIICCAFKPEKIDLDIARACVNLRLNVAGEREMPAFIDISNIKSVTKEARDYFASREAIAHVSAAAMLSSSFISKMTGTFFLSFNRPAVPIRLFTEKYDALKWLQKYRADSQNSPSN